MDLWLLHREYLVKEYRNYPDPEMYNRNSKWSGSRLEDLIRKIWVLVLFFKEPLSTSYFPQIGLFLTDV